MRTKEEAVMMRIQSIALCGLALASLSLLGTVLAEDGTADEPDIIYYQIEGSASCNSFGPNYVAGLAEKSPDYPSPDGETPFVTDGTLSVNYTIETDLESGLPVLKWDSTSELVNYVILTGGETQGNRKSLVYHFGTPGAAGGAHLSPSIALTSFQFCYGLTEGLVYEPTVNVATCYEDGVSIPLDQSNIICPDPEFDPETGEPKNKRIIFSADTEDPLAGIQVCTCNYNTDFQTCNPALLAGTPGSCMPPAVPTPFEDENGNTVIIPPGKGLQYPPAAITIFQNGTGGCYVSSTGDYECITNYDYCAYLPPGLDPNCPL
jgi:hypothetical protein